MSGIICCACSISAISVLQCALLQWRSDLNKIQETAKSRPMMNLVARTPSFVSSSTSVSKILGSPLLEKMDYGNLVRKQWASLQQIVQNRITTVFGLLKSGKLRLRRTINQGTLTELLGECCNTSSSRSNSSQRKCAIRKVRRTTSWHVGANW